MEVSPNIRVAITGMGAICGLGHNLSDVWNNIINGHSGISTINNISTVNIPIKVAGEVKQFKISEDLLSAKESSRYDKFIHYALHAAHEAYQNAGLLENNIYHLEQIGCILGVGMGGIPIIEQTYDSFLKGGPRRVSPFFIPSIIPNLSSGLISIKLGLKGIQYTVASACASASHAIIAAVNEILSERHDVIITGGAEGVLCNLPICGFNNMKALSKNPNPQKASRPFDKDRDGFVIGEGAGILVLENFEKAKLRGATIYAEIVGHGSNSDAYHITAPLPNGEGAARCMNKAIASAKISPNAIEHVNAHGTSTPLGDIGETKALKTTFNKHADNLHITSTKSMTGHLLGAAGGIESIFTAMTLHEGVIPPTINLDNPDPECDLNYTPNQARKIQTEYAINNSFGFGGANSSIIFKRYDN